MVTFAYDANIPLSDIPDISEKFIKLFIDVIGILELSEKEGFITAYEDLTRSREFEIGRVPVNIEHIQFKIGLVLQRKIVHFVISEIYRTPALKEFIENGFKTSDTIRIEKSLEYARNGNLAAFRGNKIAYTGVIVAIIVGVLSIIFSTVPLCSRLLTYRKAPITQAKSRSAKHIIKK